MLSHQTYAWVVAAVGLLACACGDAPAADARRCERPLVFGYRGAAAVAPENTLPAFRAAVDAHADGVEVDVRVTKDGALVAFHDETTGRTSDDDDDREVLAYTLRELRALDVGAWFDASFAHTTVPTLPEVLAEVPAPVRLILDVKSDAVVEPLAAFVARAGISERVLYSTFSPDRLRRLHALSPDVPLIHCLGQMASLARTPDVADYALLPRDEEITRDDIDAVAARGLLLAAPDNVLSWGDGTMWAPDILVAGDPAAVRARYSTDMLRCE